MTERAAFAIDLNTCTGCRACELACVIANDLPADRAWREVRTYNELHVHDVELFHLSLACNHCADAPCLEQCPADAYFRDPATDAVLIDEDACLGCRYCAWVCPYDAPRFDEAHGVMTKCTSCIDRRREGSEPACTEACPTGALSWRVLPEEELVQDAPGFAQDGTRPAVRITSLHADRRAPETTEPPATPPWRRLYDRIAPAITLAHEWPLALFTWMTAFLVGAFFASRFDAATPDWRWFLAAGVGGMVLSASHLGRRKRAPRAALHLRRSWLSREIVGVGVFLGAAVSVLAFPHLPGWVGWTTAILGAGVLTIIDRVYKPVHIRGLKMTHSSDVLLTGLLFAFAWGGAWRWAFYTVVSKLAVYWMRKRARTALGLNGRTVASALRMGLATAGLAVLPFAHVAGVVLIAVAELVDRCEFYDEMEIPTPASDMLDHLGERISGD